MKIRSHVHVVVYSNTHKREFKVVAVYYDRRKAERHAEGLIQKQTDLNDYISCLKIKVVDSSALQSFHHHIKLKKIHKQLQAIVDIENGYPNG